jgi:hypothetical protein
MQVLRARLYEKMREEASGAEAEARKAMVGSGDRSERIRTYNFPQGRVTDHRIGLTLHKLGEVLEGPGLGELVDALIAEDEAKRTGGARRVSTVAEALREAAARLAATSDSARLDAELLMAQALDVSRSDLLLRHMGDSAPARFAGLVERRAAHEPVAYIRGRKEFFGRDFLVAPGVLIPRMDSETTVAAALEACAAPRRVLDCGSARARCC